MEAARMMRLPALLLRVAIGLLLAAAAALQPLLAQTPGSDITLSARYWIDDSGAASINDAAAIPADQLKPMDRYRDFKLGRAALWMRFELPRLDATQRWYLLLSGAPFINRASLFVQQPEGVWTEQRAGDNVPVAQWTHPNDTPLFEVHPPPASAVWLRIQNQPAPASPYVMLISDDSLQLKRQWTYLLIGAYLGFGLLVFVVGLIHARLYGDPVFVAYCTYVAWMLLFQLAFTGAGGLFLWPHWAAFNDAAPAVTMLLMTGSGIWFMREATAISRYSRRADRFAVAFSFFGLLLTIFYVPFTGALTYGLLNLYGLAAVALSITLCLYTWRKGEGYSGWLFLGFLPVHLSYPFPALRAAGLMADNWATQYAVLIGSAIEIPLLLYILHRRAKDFSENRARLRALDSTDPLTGLTATPVLRLRLRDALRRARRGGYRCAVMLVDLANHGEIASKEGREAADRALVVAASRLSSVVREVDTVCRVADTRFAILVEGPQTDDARRAVAQRVVARGLLPVARVAFELRFKLVSVMAPDAVVPLAHDARVDEERVLQLLGFALDRLLAEDSRRVIQHIEVSPDAGDAPAVTPA
jgi:diguanylate cyclase (GGDEF)-like protein